MTHRREEGIHPVVAASTRQASIVAFENPVLNNVCHALSLCLWNGRPCEIWTLITLFQVFLDTLVRMRNDDKGMEPPTLTTTLPNAPPFEVDSYPSNRSGFISMKIRQLGVVDVRFIESLVTIQNGEAGYRSPYLSHAKRALYHVSYIPIAFEFVRIPPNKLYFGTLSLGYDNPCF